MPKKGCPVYQGGLKECSYMRQVANVMRQVLQGRDVSSDAKRLLLDTKADTTSLGCTSCAARRKTCNDETSGESENSG